MEKVDVTVELLRDAAMEIAALCAKMSVFAAVRPDLRVLVRELETAHYEALLQVHMLMMENANAKTQGANGDT